MKHPAFSQHLYLNKFYGETIKDKNLVSKCLLPISFLQNIFASQYSFLPPNDILLAKNLQKFCWQNFLTKRLCSSKACSPKFPPKKISIKKNCSPFCSPNFHPKEFAPPITPPKNLLPNIFALHFSSYNEILLTKIPPKYFCWRNFLLTRISPPKLGPQNFLPRKFALKRNCSPFSILPPPPQKKFIQKNLLPKYFLPKICCQTFLLSILLLTKNSFPNFAPQKFLLPKPLCGAVMAPD